MHHLQKTDREARPTSSSRFRPRSRSGSMLPHLYDDNLCEGQSQRHFRPHWAWRANRAHIQLLASSYTHHLVPSHDLAVTYPSTETNGGDLVARVQLKGATKRHGDCAVRVEELIINRAKTFPMR
jgi:hypothetical protein